MAQLIAGLTDDDIRTEWTAMTAAAESDPDTTDADEDAADAGDADGTDT